MEAGMKFDSDKPMMALLPPRAIEEVAKVLTYGAKKYAPNNWKKVTPRERYADAALRHLFARMRNEKDDEESGLPHLAHAVCCLLFLLEFECESGSPWGGEEMRPLQHSDLRRGEAGDR